jgi:PAS domain S-box-containing protein
VRFLVPAGRDATLLLAAAAMTVAVFVLDLVLPLGAATGMLYIFVILMGLWIKAPWFPGAAAATAWALLVVDTSLNWTEHPPAIIFFNRPLMTLLFALTAVLVRRYVHIERVSADRIRQLADLKYALDQAAIVATTDVTGRITYVNDKFCEISKYAPAELLGEDHRILNSGTHPKTFFRDLWRTIASGRVWHGELLNKAKDGTPYWVDTTIVPFVDERGHPYQYTAIRNDITERKRIEAKLREQAALAHVGQLAAVVAHEVRNPLAGIKGAMQVLSARRPAGDPEAPVMRDIVSRIDSLSDLINDLLFFARPQPPRLAPVALAPLLGDAAHTLHADPAGRDVVVKVDVPEMIIEADAVMIKALFLNLLLNAAQAMQGRGAIAVTAAIEGRHVRISVRDHGPGIPEHIVRQIFEPFFTTKVRGGGLGLAIARRTAELHDGSLSVASPPDGGAEMIVTLALRPLQAEPSAAE